MVRIFIYIVAWVILIYQAIVNSAPALSILAIGMGILPVISVGIVIIQAYQLKVQMVSKDISAQAKEVENLKIRITNNGFLPIGRATIYLQILYGQGKAGKDFKVDFAIPSREIVTLSVPLIAEYCGIATIKIRKLKTQALMVSFSRRIRKGQSSTVTILPYFKELPLQFERKNPYLISDSERYQEGQAGNDPSEVFQIREYRQGDKLQRIHWKLTAKKDELLVKDYSLPLEYDTFLLLDLNQINQQNFHVLVQTAVSLSWSLISLNRQHILAWYDGEHKEAVCRYIENEEDVYELLRVLLITPPVNEPEAITEILKYCRNRQFNRIITLTSLNHKLDFKLKDYACFASRKYLLAPGLKIPEDYVVPDAMKPILLDPYKLEDSLNGLAMVLE